MSDDAPLTEGLRETAHRLTGASQDYDPLMDRIGNARLVLLGKASHGTHEFYHQRAQITQRLIKEKGFTAVAVEADWPDMRRRAMEYARRDGRVAEDELFYAEQNARLVKNAEEYYRSMFLQEVPSWNLPAGDLP
jgi:erythromycin esterase-like protein